MSFWSTTIRPYLPPWAGGGYVPDEPQPTTMTHERMADYFVPLHWGEGYCKYGLCTSEEVRIAFRLCSPLPAIISQKANAFTKGTIVVWNPNTEKPVRGQFKEWEKLFRQPNKIQSGRRFFIQAYSYVQMYGYCVIDPTYPIGFKDRPSELRVIPNWAIEWDWGNGFNAAPVRAWFTINGKREPLDMDNLIIIRDTASVDFDKNGWLPLSRAAALEAEVSNIIAGLNARGQMVTDRGAQGLISGNAKDSAGAMPLKPTEQIRLQSIYNNRGLGILRGQDKIVVTDGNVGFTPMTFDVNELGLHPEHIACVKSICNVYAFPFTALAEGFEGKYNNSSNGRRDFQDTTIDPESMDFFEQLSLGLGMYEQNCEAYMDYSGVASVQASQEEKGKGEQAMAAALQTQWDLGIVTRNDIRDKLGWDKVNGMPDEFDKYKFETASALEAKEMEQQNMQNNGSNTAA